MAASAEGNPSVEGMPFILRVDDGGGVPATGTNITRGTAASPSDDTSHSLASNPSSAPLPGGSVTLPHEEEIPRNDETNGGTTPSRFGLPTARQLQEEAPSGGRCNTKEPPQKPPPHYPEALPGPPLPAVQLIPLPAHYAPQQPGQLIIAPQDWSTSLFEDLLTDCPAAVDAFVCPYCLGSAHFNMLIRGLPGIYWPLCCCMCVADTYWLSAFHCVASTQLLTLFVRRELRRRHGIWGAESEATGAVAGGPSILLDILASCCCTPCTAAQHHREMTLREQCPGPVVFSRAVLRPTHVPTTATIQ